MTVRQRITTVASIWIVAVVCVVLIASWSLAVVADGDRELRHQRAMSEEARIDLAFVCGFRSGQRAITARMPTFFTHPDDRADGPVAPHCKPLLDRAVKQGLQP